MIHLSGKIYRWLTGGLIVFASFAVISVSVHTLLQASTVEVSVKNEPPAIQEIQVNQSGAQQQPAVRAVTLHPGSLSKYYVIAEVSDANSIFDITDVFVTAYRSGIQEKASCVRDPKNCYRVSMGDGECTLEPATITDGFVKCRIDFAHWMDSTQGNKALFENEDWVFDVVVEDGEGEQIHDTYTREVNSLLAIDIPKKTNFELPENGADRSVVLPVTVTNNGNAPVSFTMWFNDIQCEVGVIPAENQKVANASEEFFDVNVFEGNVYVEVDLPPQRSDEPSKETFLLNLDIPDGVVGGCAGETTITGI